MPEAGRRIGHRIVKRVGCATQDGVDTNVQNKSGQSPLHVAQNVAVAEALVNANCDTAMTNQVCEVARIFYKAARF